MGKKKNVTDNTVIDDDVIASVVVNSIKDIDGFGGFCEKAKNIFNLKNHVEDLKYVDVIRNEDSFSFNVYVSVFDGYSIPAVSAKIQSAVKLSLERALEKTVDEVKVFVKAVIFGDEPTKQR